MRKLLSAVLAVATIFTFVSCSKSDDTKTNSKENNTSFSSVGEVWIKKTADYETDTAEEYLYTSADNVFYMKLLDGGTGDGTYISINDLSEEHIRYIDDSHDSFVYHETEVYVSPKSNDRLYRLCGAMSVDDIKYRKTNEEGIEEIGIEEYIEIIPDEPSNETQVEKVIVQYIKSDSFEGIDLSKAEAEEVEIIKSWN